MKFTPFSIKSQEFNKSMRGFDPDEVNTFLEDLSYEFERLSSENEKLKREVIEKDEQLVSFRKIEKNLQNTLLNAQESTSKTVESTKKQTALMVKEAELKSNQIITKAREDADKIRNTVLKLREEKDLLIAQIRTIVETQSEILSGGGSYSSAEEKSEGSKKEKDKPKSDINADDILEQLL